MPKYYFLIASKAREERHLPLTSLTGLDFTWELRMSLGKVNTRLAVSEALREAPITSARISNPPKRQGDCHPKGRSEATEGVALDRLLREVSSAGSA